MTGHLVIRILAYIFAIGIFTGNDTVFKRYMGDYVRDVAVLAVGLLHCGLDAGVCASLGLCPASVAAVDGLGD